MATTSSLAVRIYAKISELSRGLAKASKKVSAFAKRAGSSIAKFAADVAKKFALIGGGGAAAFTALAASASKNARELQVWSKTLNVGVKDLQRWQFAAKSVGFDTEKLTDIFKDVNDKVGDFIATGGGEAAQIFKSLGVSAQELKRLDPGEVLLRLARATQDLSTQERIFAFEALANDASKLFPLLERGGRGLRKTSEDFKSLGLSLDSGTLNILSKLSSGFTTITTSIKVFFSKLVALAAPTILDIIGKIKDWVESMGGIGAVAEMVFTKVVSVFNSVKGNIVGFIDSIVNKFISLKEMFGGIGNFFTNIGITMSNISLQIQASIKDIVAGVNQVISALVRAPTLGKDPFGLAASFDSTVESMTAQAKDLTDQIKPLVGISGAKSSPFSFMDVIQTQLPNFKSVGPKIKSQSALEQYRMGPSSFGNVPKKQTTEIIIKADKGLSIESSGFGSISDGNRKLTIADENKFTAQQRALLDQ